MSTPLPKQSTCHRKAPSGKAPAPRSGLRRELPCAPRARDAGRVLPRWARPVIAGALLLVSICGATAIGIIDDLIARGYGLLSWVFIVILIVPLLTVGTWRIATGSLSDMGTNPVRSP